MRESHKVEGGVPLLGVLEVQGQTECDLEGTMKEVMSHHSGLSSWEVNDKELTLRVVIDRGAVKHALEYGLH